MQCWSQTRSPLELFNPKLNFMKLHAILVMPKSPITKNNHDFFFTMMELEAMDVILEVSTNICLGARVLEEKIAKHCRNMFIFLNEPQNIGMS